MSLQGMHTPWGPCQESKVIAEGIVWVSTASHGGYYVDAERWRQFDQDFPGAPLFAGKRWFEEDGDWCLVVLMWPGYFTDDQVFNAVRTVGINAELNHSQDNAWWAALRDKLQGSGVQAIHDRIAREVADKWEVGSAGTGKGSGWSVGLHRGEERITVQFPGYPDKQFYTMEEIEQIRREVAQ